MWSFMLMVLASMAWGAAMTAAKAYGTCATDVLKTPNCWHLPTKTELQLLFEQKNVVGGFTNNWYWSSTENDSINAWLQNFFNGSQGSQTKEMMYVGVRAVRAF